MEVKAQATTVDKTKQLKRKLFEARKLGQHNRERVLSYRLDMINLANLVGDWVQLNAK